MDVGALKRCENIGGSFEPQLLRTSFEASRASFFWESAWDFEAISLRLSESMTFLDVAAALLSVQRVAP